jgi:hypothetical protein
VLQTAFTYFAVTAAAAWVVWAILLPKGVRRALAGRFSRGKAGPGGDCGCGGGGCGG